MEASLRDENKVASDGEADSRRIATNRIIGAANMETVQHRVLTDIALSSSIDFENALLWGQWCREMADAALAGDRELASELNQHRIDSKAKIDAHYDEIRKRNPVS